MIGLSESERELLRLVRDCDGGVSKEEIVNGSSIAGEDVDELVEGLDDYLRRSTRGEAGGTAAYELFDSVPECSGCGRLLAFKETQQYEDEAYCYRHYKEIVDSERREQALDFEQKKHELEEIYRLLHFGSVRMGD